MGLDFERLEKTQLLSSLDVVDMVTHEKQHIVYTTPLFKLSTFTEIFNQIAHLLSPIFDDVITDLFVKVMTDIRSKTISKDVVNDKDTKEQEEEEEESSELTREQIIKQGIQYAPIKTIGRANAKAVEYDCVPGISGIKDWVRIALIVENEHECVQVFKKICEVFDGKIARVKNGFDISVDGEQALHYRALLINLVFDYETFYVPKKKTHQIAGVQTENSSGQSYWKMLCEIQIILRNYLDVRSHLHLFYKILRCVDTNPDVTSQKIADDFSKYFEVLE